MNINKIKAKRAEKMQANVIREILKVIADPAIISLAGGLPAPETFPVNIIKKLHNELLEQYGDRLLQYDVTEGFLPFRETIVEYVKKFGIKANLNEIYITNGATGAIAAISKSLLDEGDKIAVEAPTYLGAMTAFNPYSPQYIEIEMDEEGIIPESLENILRNHKIKFIYLNPTFQNPTGKTLGLKRRQQVAEIIKKYDALVLEDNPYGQLRYQGKDVPSIKSLAPENVIYLGTFSKVLAPSFRLGFVVVPEELGKLLTFAKQAMDLHSQTIGQAVAMEYIKQGYLDKQISKIIEIYKPRQQAMLQALDKYFPKSYNWSCPEGGMFVWIEGPEGIDAEKIYWQAIENKVAFVPGKFFYADTGKSNPLKNRTLRLNFTMVNEQKIEQAVERLAKVL